MNSGTVEIITGSERRRRWRLEAKLRVVPWRSMLRARRREGFPRDSLPILPNARPVASSDRWVLSDYGRMGSHQPTISSLLD